MNNDENNYFKYFRFKSSSIDNFANTLCYILMYGKNAVLNEKAKMFSDNGRSINSYIEHPSPIYTLDHLLEITKLKLKLSSEFKGIKSFKTFYEKLIVFAYKNNLITDFSNPIYSEFSILKSCLNTDFLNDLQITELLNSSNQDVSNLKSKNDKLEFLLQNNLISEQTFDYNKTMCSQTKTVKCYANCILINDSLSKIINDMVKDISFNYVVATRGLCYWVQEPSNVLLLESSQDFLNDTLNNSTFYRQLFRGAGNENSYIVDSESWKLIEPKMNKLVGTEYCNSVGSLCDQYMENYKLHINNHIQLGLPQYMLRYALTTLPNAKFVSKNNKKCIQFTHNESVRVMYITHLYKSIEKGYWKKSLFPEEINNKLTELFNLLKLTKEPDFNPVIDLTEEEETYETYIEPVLEYYNIKLNLNVNSLDKSKLKTLLDTLEISYKKNDSLGELLNKIRIHLGLEIIEDVRSIKKIQSILHKPDFYKYSLNNRIKDGSSSFRFRPNIMKLFNLIRLSIPDEESKDDVLINKGWTAVPLAQYELSCIRFDTKTLTSIAHKFTDIKGETINEILNVDTIQKLIKEKKKELRKKARKANKLSTKRINKRKALNGMGTLFNDLKGWTITSFLTNTVSISLTLSRLVPDIKTIPKDNFEIAKEYLLGCGESGVRIISDDLGRVNKSYTAERKIINDKVEYEYKRFTRKDYYKKSSIDYFTKKKEELKQNSPEILNIEKFISEMKGFRCRSYENYKTLLETYLGNDYHKTLISYYSDLSFMKEKMILWRKKRMVIQQFISELFKVTDKERKSKKYKPIIYCVGDVNFSSHGKGEKAVPTRKYEIEFRNKMKQMNSSRRPIVMVKENEYYTSQKHHICGKQLEKMYNEEGYEIRSWKLCLNCKINSKGEQSNKFCYNGTYVMKVTRDRNSTTLINVCIWNRLNDLPRPEYLCRGS